MQPIDERLVQKIHELVADSVNSVAEMERHLHSHVKHKLFQGRAGPDTTNRRFHPTHSDIRNHMYMAAVQHANPKSIKNIYNLRLMIVAKRVPWWQHCLQATIRWRRRKLKGIKRRLQSCCSCSCCWCWWWGHCLHQQTTKPWWALQQLALRTPNEMAKKNCYRSMEEKFVWWMPHTRHLAMPFHCSSSVSRRMLTTLWWAHS